MRRCVLALLLLLLPLAGEAQHGPVRPPAAPAPQGLTGARRGASRLGRLLRVGRTIPTRRSFLLGAAALLVTPPAALQGPVSALGRALAATARAVDPMVPHGSAVPLTRPLRRFIGSTGWLKLEALAPFASVAPLRDTADLYTSKTVVDVRRMIEGLAETIALERPAEAAALRQVLAPLVANRYVLRLPAHQFALGDGTLGNRTAFYGGARGHGDIDRITHELAKQGLTLVKAMTEFHKGAQGGTLEDIIQDMVSGVHHIGGYYEGTLGGRAVTVRSDWPSSYAILDDAHEMYNAHLLAVDYQAGANKEIPPGTLQEYARNYALWDTLTGITVGFSSADRIPDHRPYTNNPLEIYDRDTLRDAAKVFGTMDRRLILSKGTNYCAEGRWNGANLASNVLIRKGRFPGFDRLIEEFQRAPGLDRAHPERGWKHLADQGLISADEYKGLLQTNRVAVYLDWARDDVLEYDHYDPKQKDGFVAEPMTLAGLVRGLFRAHYPRERVGEAVAAELARVHAAGGAPAAIVEKLLGGLDPQSEQGGTAAQALGVRLASAALARTLDHPQFRELVLGKLGYQFIAEEGDKRRVDAVYQKFVAALRDPTLDTRARFDARLAEIDQELRGMRVRMFVHDPLTLERTSIREVPFWSWAPPQAWVWWAQYPDLWNSGAVRYVTTLMHANQMGPRQVPLTP